jgi:hypothetical protein
MKFNISDIYHVIYFLFISNTIYGLNLFWDTLIF